MSSANVAFTVTGDSRVDRLLGTEGDFGQEQLGLRRTAAQDVIRAVATTARYTSDTLRRWAWSERVAETRSGLMLLVVTAPTVARSVRRQ